MENKQRGIYKIELDKERIFKLDFNAMVALEEMGLSLEEFGSDNKPLSSIRAILWAGLIHEDPSLTLTDVGNLLSFDKIKEITEFLTDVFGDMQEKK